MKRRSKNSYVISMIADDITEPPEKTPRPVFVQAWNFKEALQKGADAVMPVSLMHAKLRVVKLRHARPIDHAWNGRKDFYVNREPVIRTIVPV